jgi:threonine/homoserine/homoserine lactone efflux protein|tara:strand:- start:5 stop:643 length:639 start_codon:yes stop_codon:yes gene_type:complete
MEIDLVIGLAIAGITLGIIEGIKPGPLLTIVIRETLSGGFKAGIRAASAPIFTDGPLIILSIFVAGWIATQPLIFCGISLVGAIFLTRMGLECFSPEIPDIDSDKIDISRSFKRGIITNLLNPSVYVFWFLVGGPIMATAADTEPLAPVAYAISFLVSIVSVKITIAYFFSKAQVNLSSSNYQLVLRICGIAMLFFAISFVYRAFELWQDGF